MTSANCGIVRAKVRRLIQNSKFKITKFKIDKHKPLCLHGESVPEAMLKQVFCLFPGLNYDQASVNYINNSGDDCKLLQRHLLITLELFTIYSRVVCNLL
jgi:hypothetical protein